MSSFFNKIRVVLVETSHPGNIGSVARAMKTMGLQRLYLVNPKTFPHPEANTLASHATDILEQAIITESFEQAIQDCHLVLGTSARIRSLPWPSLTAREAGKLAINDAQNNTEIAIVFGRERTGLNNEELQHCHYQIEIPSNPEYSSLNIAAAVQILCYEIRMSVLENENSSAIARSAATWQSNQEKEIPLKLETIEEFATAKQTESFYNYLEQLLFKINFLDPNVPNQVITRLRRLYSRTRLTNVEINVMRGILSAMEKKL